MAEQQYDLAVVGAGPGGYVCALRAAQLGMKVVCVDRRAQPGGTCLNIGCIPSKALLGATHHYQQAARGRQFGFSAGGLEFDVAALMQAKTRAVEGNVKGVAFLLRKNNIPYRAEAAKLKGQGELLLASGETIKAKHIVLATGAQAVVPDFLSVDEEQILTSTGALALNQVPTHLVILGAGYIGLELGSVWRRLGAKITIVEQLPRIAPGMDGETASLFRRALERQGLIFKCDSRLVSATRKENKLIAEIESAQGREVIEATHLLVSIGRKPALAELGLDEVKLAQTPSGAIEVNSVYQTSMAGVYAIGDMIEGLQLAHRASEEGIVLAELLAGQRGAAVNYQAIPAVVYTSPEVASIGATEEALKEAGTAYKAGKAPFVANGRAKADQETEGQVKILADAASDRILGVHIIGAQAGLMIAQAVTAMEFSAASEDIARMSHAHPSLSESFKEAALAVQGRALHQ